MSQTETRIGSLCTGYGGLDAAAEAVFGGELAWVADNDPHVSTLLSERFPGVPNLGDITTQPDAEPVDIVTAGFPCQPISGAGKGLGIDDERWIWPDILAFVGRMDPPPRLLLLENVPRLLTINGGDAMAQVVEGLASLGYMGRYRLLRAADVGACHRRERWFCVAHANGSTVGSQPFSKPRGGDTPEPGQHLPTPTSWLGRRPEHSVIGGSARRGSTGSEVVDAIANLPTPTATDARGGRNATARKPGDTFDAGWTLSDVRYADRWGDYAEAIAQHEQTVDRPAPDPTTDGKLNPAFVEWMMMLPEGWVTDLDLPRTAQLRILGNGVVPAQAAAAYSMLAARSDTRRREG